MIRYIVPLLFGASALTLGNADAPAQAAPKVSLADDRQIDSITRSGNVLGSKWGIELVDVKTGKVMYAKNAQTLFSPASNMKLVTALVGLAQLGPDHKVDPRIAGGVRSARQ